MKKYIFLLTCLFSANFVAAQSTIEQKDRSCIKRMFCSDKAKKSCYTKCDKQKTNELGTANSLKKWRVGAVGFSMGAFADMYHNMTDEGMKSMAINLPQREINLEGYRKTYGENEVMIEGGMLGGYVSLNPRRRDGSGYNLNQELRLGVGVNLDREAMIQYQDEVSGTENSVIYCLIENELMLSGSYLVKFRLSNRFSLYGGGGMNLGGTFNNAFLLIEDKTVSNEVVTETTEVQALSSYYTRGFAHGGVAYHTKGRVSFHLDFKTGMGMQIVNGAKNNLISESCVGQIGVQYSFMKK